MLSLLYNKLPHFRFLLTVLVGIMLAESVMGAYSIALLVPLSQTILSGSSEFLLPGLPKSVGTLLATLPQAWIFLLFGIILMCKAVLTYIRNVVDAFLARRLRNYWMIGLTETFILRDYSKTHALQQGGVISVLVREILRSVNFISASMAYTAGLVYFLALSVLVLIADWRVPLAGLPIAILAYYIVLRPLIKYSDRNGSTLQIMMQDLSAAISEALSGLKDIKIFNIERHRLNKIEEQTRETSRKEFQYAIIQDLPKNLTEFIFSAGVIILGFILLHMSSGINLTGIMPAAIFFMVAGYKMFGQLSDLASQKVKIANRRPSFLLICDLMCSNDDAEDLNSGQPVDKLETDIEIKSLFFGYNKDAPVFRGGSATIKRGHINFLYGPSGTGKSTLLDILTRLIEPDSGEICANGTDIRKFRKGEWRRLFGYVSQEPYLFSGTIAENIRLDINTDDETIRQAAVLAGADTFIRETENGYETILHERGTNLSGGQKRRIALARALLRRPSVLILDEATSTIETTLERSILSDLRKMSDLTVLLVTHRHDNDDLADAIHELKDGQIISRVVPKLA